MGLFDYVAPSDRVAELGLIVRRIRKHTGLAVVPMLVVEGRMDEPALGALCKLGNDGVFSAGTRSLVEQMLVLETNQPMSDCVCAYLIDCDGRGKTDHLADRRQLVVTETCDLESDLVEIGVASRVVTPFLPSAASADALVERAKEVALPLSAVRRAAHLGAVSMKRDGRQLRLAELHDDVAGAWCNTTPSDDDVISVIADLLGWSCESTAAVRQRLGRIDRTPSACLMGKDVIDALFLLVRDAGHGDVRGWTSDYFHSAVLRAVQPDDSTDWIVAERLRAWASGCGQDLLW